MKASLISTDRELADVIDADGKPVARVCPHTLPNEKVG